MSDNKPATAPDEEFGLIVADVGVRPDLVKQLGLVLNYFFGYNMMLARSPEEAAGMAAEHGDAVSYVILFADGPLMAATMARLSREGRLPVVVLMPGTSLDAHLDLAETHEQLHLVDVDAIGVHDGAALRTVLSPIFERHGIGSLWDRAQHVSFRVLEQRVQKRIRHLHTLPTLPEVVLRILAVIEDPDSTSGQLEEVLHSDPAIVHKLLQVVNTPTFAGIGQRGEWGLRDAIVRLGRRKVGSLALQIKLINSLIKPEESGFDLRRFWIHSVGTAHIADRLLSSGRIRVDDEDEASLHHHWVAALMHDIGKLILGFFFWEHFERLAQLSASLASDFRSAESHLGDVVTHEQLGQLLLLRAGMDEQLVRCAGTHHEPGKLPGALLALIHVADNLCKALGMGTLHDEAVNYDAAALRVLGLDADGIEGIRQDFGPELVQEVADTVERCTGS